MIISSVRSLKFARDSTMQSCTVSPLFAKGTGRLISFVPAVRSALLTAEPRNVSPFHAEYTTYAVPSFAASSSIVSESPPNSDETSPTEASDSAKKA